MANLAGLASFVSVLKAVRTNLPLRIEVDSLALRLRVVVGVSDGVVADGDRFNIGGDDPDFVGVDDDVKVSGRPNADAQKRPPGAS